MYTTDVDVNGQRVRELRQDHVLTLRELADKSGVSKDTINRIEHGHGAYPSTIRKLARALGVEPRELVKGARNA
jgi:transcriptional regulator with XRE-family HTH domain